jgi:hypothetical protein
MHRLCKISGALVVWATAATTLLAGTPHFDCRCPDGSIKRFCFGPASGEWSCCFNGKGCGAKSNEIKSCCRKGRSGSQATVKPSCCSKQNKRERSSVTPRKQPVDGLTLRGAGCQKTLAAPEFQSSVRPTTTLDETPALSFVLSSAAALEYLSNGATSRTAWQVHWLPPPTDLVTNLRRLVI